MKQDKWIFFRDVFGRWQWERRGEGAFVIAVSCDFFADAEACKQDAKREGYHHGIDEATFPPDFEQKP